MTTRATTIPAIAPTGNPLDLLTVLTIAGPPLGVGVSVDEGFVCVTLDAEIATIFGGASEVVV